MISEPSTNARVLGLFFDLLASARGRTKARVRELPGYAGLSDSAFESQFQRDKDALRESGIVVEVEHGPLGEHYRVSIESFAPAADAPLDETDLALIHMAVRAWSGGDVAPGAVAPKILALADAPAPAAAASPRLDLAGADLVARLVGAIRDARPVSFTYASRSGVAERAVEPWRLIVRGRALYLWGMDLDRTAPRVFRLSRITAPVEVLGEPGDAGGPPGDAADPFADLFVAPVLALAPDAPGAVASRMVGRAPSDAAGSSPGGWEAVLAEEDEVGAWISLVLSAPDRVVVVEPASLREEVLSRLTAAAGWEDCDA
ncbi:WYL domain-containing protein [Actinomyces sp. B33]|uniref:helix-turn-helix transcriptional regulator n=1 Tax=Actinomyces sp. B33 TaxID=2942131 RepID=UPI00233FDC9B|nr:WYL domain-containing protein [Actinomyces sp. B33]MDC4233313.1 WYL domain-containing protein [Actinomyces sp. B33]